MKITRRSFLRGALALSLVPAIAWPARQSVEAARYDLVSKASRDTFSPLVDSEFQIFTMAGRVRVTLAYVSSTLSDPYSSGFSLLFHGPQPTLEPAIYLMRHDELGEFYLFISPVGRQRGHATYEAVFSRMTREV